MLRLVHCDRWKTFYNLAKCIDIIIISNLPNCWCCLAVRSFHQGFNRNKIQRPGIVRWDGRLEIRIRRFKLTFHDAAHCGDVTGALTCAKKCAGTYPGALPKRSVGRFTGDFTGGIATQCGAFTGLLVATTLKSPLFPRRGRAGIHIDRCISELTLSWYFTHFGAVRW